MAINFDNAFGNHAAALTLRARRAGLLASNLANADTPGFKARDFDFRRALQEATGVTGGDSVRMARTNASHMDASGGTAAAAASAQPTLQFRVPEQPSVDGNTVDVQTERAAFTENAVRYQASLGFLNARIQGLRRALRGE